MLTITETNAGVSFSVRVTPRARRNEIAGVVGDVLKVNLKAPPVEGKANAALVELLARWLGVKRSQIEIIAGAASRNKIVRVAGLTRERIERKLG